MALVNALISECWWFVWGVIHLLNGHILSITVCPEVCTGISTGYGVWQPIMKGAWRGDRAWKGKAMNAGQMCVFHGAACNPAHCSRQPTT